MIFFLVIYTQLTCQTDTEPFLTVKLPCTASVNMSVLPGITTALPADAPTQSGRLGADSKRTHITKANRVDMALNYLWEEHHFTMKDFLFYYVNSDSTTKGGHRKETRAKQLATAISP
jgi:hypothetical protein